MNRAKVEALLNPRSVAILGARDNPSGWTARIFANLGRFGFAGPAWPINPRAAEMWGVKCYADLAALPGVPDHLVVMLAASKVAETLREAARLGTRSATLYAAGFAESGTAEGLRLQQELIEVIAETGLAVSGPNCLGNLSAPARLLSLPDDRIQEIDIGPVAMVGQSGTATPAIGRTVMGRGIGVSYIVTSGNEIGLATADFIDYFAADPRIRVIFCLIEAVRRPHDFLAACRRARDAGKPVVALKMGGSQAGRAAALAHTGSLAGALEAFDAIAGDAGVIRAHTADDAVNIIELMVAGPPPRKNGAGVLVYSGGLSGLSTDAADRHGIPLPQFSDETVAKIRAVIGDGYRMTNPLDAAGFVNLAIDDLLKLVAAVRDDENVGTVLMQEDVPPSEGENDANRRRAQRVISTLEAINDRLLVDGGKPVNLISVNSSDMTPFGRKARQRFPRVALLNEPDRAFRALRSVCAWRDRAMEARTATARLATPSAASERFVEQWRGMPRGTPLSEPESKELLRAYGLLMPEERLCSTADETAAAAGKIGFPVVVKAVAAKLIHKSDAGAVMLGLRTAEEVLRACALIQDNVAAYDGSITLEGFLVAKAISGGVELVLGIQNDPEMGPVVMFGSGGILLELFKDVAFGVPGLSGRQAEAMIGRTKADTLLKGYRGRGPFDVDAVIEAIVATGRLASDLGTCVQSIDVNPLVALPAGQGAWVLDGLVIVGG